MKENYKAIIRDRVQTISRLTGYPLNREEAEQQNSRKYLFIDNYRGHKLVLINTESGGETPLSYRNNTRLSAPAFLEVLDAMIFGLEYGKGIIR